MHVRHAVASVAVVALAHVHGLAVVQSQSKLQAQPHAEQRVGYTPPSALADDGWNVDGSLLDDLVQSRNLVIIHRKASYTERRSDGYTEPKCIYLLGTSHVSEQSALDVQRLVAAVKPESIVVELCRGRLGMMFEEVEAVGEESDTRSGNQALVYVRAALARVAASITGEGSSTAVRPGVDFRAANACAEAIGAEIVLGDRPIEITLKRAWDALTLLEKGKLVAGLAMAVAATGSTSISEQAAEPIAVPAAASAAATAGASPLTVSSMLAAARSGRIDDDTVDAMLASLAVAFPAVTAPLVTERDAYLAWSLKRSRAVCGKRRVVGVVGRAHLAGVAAAIERDCGGDTLVFKDLVGRGRSPR